MKEAEREGLPLLRWRGSFGKAAASCLKCEIASTLVLRQLAARSSQLSSKRRFSFFQVIVNVSQNDILLELVFSL